MLIFIDNENCIKAINETTNDNLSCIEIDRDKIFPNFSDFMILNYKYIPQEYGYILCPSRDYDELLYLENKEIIKEQGDKISTLTDEINELKAFNAQLVEVLNANADTLI